METITLRYDPRNAVIKSIINSAVVAGAEIEEKEVSPYNQEFVRKIRRSEKQPGVKVNIDDLWK